MTTKIRELAFEGASTQNIRKAALAQGMNNLYNDGIHKVLNGITTIEEVFRVAKRNEEQLLGTQSEALARTRDSTSDTSAASLTLRVGTKNLENLRVSGNVRIIVVASQRLTAPGWRFFVSSNGPGWLPGMLGQAVQPDRTGKRRRMIVRPSV